MYDFLSNTMHFAFKNNMNLYSKLNGCFMYYTVVYILFN